MNSANDETHLTSTSTQSCTPPEFGRCVGGSDVNRYKRILVTLNLTALDTAVVRYANLMARLTQTSRIDLVNIVNTRQVPQGLIAAHPALLQSVAKRNKRALRELVRQHLRVPSSCDVQVHVLRGSPVEKVLEFARSEAPDLLIVGRDPKNSRSGSVPERLAATAPCSVLVVPKASTPSIRSILGGVDLSSHSRAVVKHAVALGRAAELRSVYCMHVYDVPDGLRGSGLTSEELGASIKVMAQSSWEMLLGRIESNGINLVPIFRRGPFPTLELKEEVKRSSFDLVIIAARGRSAAGNAFLGSVAQRVVNATETPLLVVKSKRHSTELLLSLLELLERPTSQGSQ